MFRVAIHVEVIWIRVVSDFRKVLVRCRRVISEPEVCKSLTEAHERRMDLCYRPAGTAYCRSLQAVNKRFNTADALFFYSELTEIVHIASLLHKARAPLLPEPNVLPVAWFDNIDNHIL